MFLAKTDSHLSPLSKSFFFIIVKLFFGLRCKFKIWALHNSIYRARFLTQTTINTLEHINIISSSFSTPIFFLSSDSIVIACAGQTASHNLHAIHLSSPFGYLLNACSPLNLGLIEPFQMDS